MAETVAITIDAVEVEARAGQTIMEAADAAGIYIPRLCFLAGLSPFGSCRVCTVIINGRPGTACTTPVAPGMTIENDTDHMMHVRRNLIDMLFVEGNHYCMFCEASGRCELQALAYRFGITAPKYPYMYPEREVDATHPDILIDHNRCILCARCIRTAKEKDKKDVLGFVGRGRHKHLAPSSHDGLAGTRAKRTDKMVESCPVGALLPKRRGYDIPVGRRPYDCTPIGSEIEGRRANEESNEA